MAVIKLVFFILLLINIIEESSRMPKHVTETPKAAKRGRPAGSSNKKNAFKSSRVNNLKKKAKTVIASALPAALNAAADIAANVRTTATVPININVEVTEAVPTNVEQTEDAVPPTICGECTPTTNDASSGNQDKKPAASNAAASATTRKSERGESKRDFYKAEPALYPLMSDASKKREANMRQARHTQQHAMKNARSATDYWHDNYEKTLMELIQTRYELWESTNENNNNQHIKNKYEAMADELQEAKDEIEQYQIEIQSFQDITKAIELRTNTGTANLKSGLSEARSRARKAEKDLNDLKGMMPILTDVQLNEPEKMDRISSIIRQVFKKSFKNVDDKELTMKLMMGIYLARKQP